MRRHGYTVDDLFAGDETTAFQNVMRSDVQHARGLFVEGLPLIKMVDRRLSLDLIFSRGGMFILDKIERENYRVLVRRPAITKIERVMLLLEKPGAPRGCLSNRTSTAARSRGRKRKTSIIHSCCYQRNSGMPCARFTRSCGIATI